MSQVLVTESYLEDIADAIREKNGTETTYKPPQMAAAIEALPDPSVLDSKSITANGTYDPSDDDLDGYDEVTVNVPNSYAAGDEGKVVSNGALVAQTARSSNITDNGTYDTTLNDEVTVAVSGGGEYTPLRYDLGNFYGDISGNVATSLTCIYSVSKPSKMFLIVMHRDTITINDNNFTLIRKDQNGSYGQYISIYSREFSSAVSNQSVIISQASSVRICACSFFMDSDLTITGMTVQPYDSQTVGQYAIRTINPSSNDRLIVFSDAWVNSTGSGYARNLTPPQNVLPQNYINKDGVQSRLVAFIPNAKSDIVYDPHMTITQDVLDNNQMNIYSLSRS